MCTEAGSRWLSSSSRCATSRTIRLRDERELAGNAMACENFDALADDFHEACVGTVGAREDERRYGISEFRGRELHAIALDDAGFLEPAMRSATLVAESADGLADLGERIATVALQRANDRTIDAIESVKTRAFCQRSLQVRGSDPLFRWFRLFSGNVSRYDAAMRLDCIFATCEIVPNLDPDDRMLLGELRKRGLRSRLRSGTIRASSGVRRGYAWCARRGIITADTTSSLRGSIASRRKRKYATTLGCCTGRT